MIKLNLSPGPIITGIYNNTTLDTINLSKIAKIATVIIGAFAAIYAIYICIKECCPPKPKKPLIVIKPIYAAKKENRSQIKDDEDLAKELQKIFDEELKSTKAPVKAPEFTAPSTTIFNSKAFAHSPPIILLDEPTTIPLSVKKLVVTPSKPVESIPKPSAPIPSTNPFVIIENTCAEAAEQMFNTKASAKKTIDKLDVKITEKVLDNLNEIISEYEKRCKIYTKIGYKEAVESYFANIGGDPTKIKYLSLIGIRNLLHFGPSIIDDFREKNYLGGDHNYSSLKGLKTFKHYTGNTVHLDTAFDAANDAAAIKFAKEKIIQFGKQQGLDKIYSSLTAEKVASHFPDRKLELPHSGSVRKASSHTDRSNEGVWKYQNPASSKIEYYVNVPNCDIVFLATLRLPYMFAELLYLTKEQKDSKLLNEFYDTLFDKGLSVGCYDDKAREFINFYHDWKMKIAKAPSPEEEAKQKLASGFFGVKLKNQNSEMVIKKALDRSKLIEVLSNLDIELKGRSLEKLIFEEEDKIVKYLLKKGLWENTLYRSEEGKDYFLLDAKTLTPFMKDFHEYLKYM